MNISPRLSRRFQRLSFVLVTTGFLMLAVPSATYAQMGGIDPDPGDRGTGGRNTIEGRIYLPGGVKLNVRAKVKLRSSVGDSMFQLSDDSGAFAFRRLRGGTYTVTVDAGKDFEPASETVDIIEPARRSTDPGNVFNVTVMLQPRRDGPAAKPGTVDASTAAAPEAARDLYKQAVDAAHDGDRKKAIELLKQAVVVFPNFMTALNELGVQYLALKQYKEAAEALRAAIKIAPDAFHPHLNYGIALLQLKDYKGALGELQIAVQKDSSSAVAHLQFGRALVNVGNYEAAERSLKQSLSIGGEDVVEAHRYLAAVYIEKQKSELAADELESYLKLAPKTKDADRIRTMIKELRSQASGKPR